MITTIFGKCGWRPTLATALFALTAACVPTIYAPPKKSISIKPFDFALRNLTYPSGLTVLVERDTRTPLTGVFLVVGAGASSDPEGKEGLAHLVEHLTFRSRSKGGSAPGPELSALLRQAGSVLDNARTDLDSTVFFELGATAALPGLLEVEGQRMLSAVVSVPDDVRATELEVVKSELRLRNETGYVGDVVGALQGMIFPPGHAYARPVSGTRESLSGITPEDVTRFVRANYRPDNMTLLILGDVDLDTIDRMVAGTLPPALLTAKVPFQRFPRLMKVPPPLAFSPPAPAQLPRREASISGPELWLAWALPRGFDSDRYLLYVAAHVANAYLADRTSEKEVESADVEIIPGVQASMMVCRLKLRSADHAEAVRSRVVGGLNKIFWRLSSALPDFSRAAMVAEVIDAENLALRGLRRATVSHFSQDPTLYSRTFHQLATLDLDKVGREFGQYITEERARAVLVLPPAGGAAQLAESGREGGAAEGSQSASPPSERTGWPPGVGVDHEEERRRDLVPAVRNRQAFKLPNGVSVKVEVRPGLPVVTAALSFIAAPASRSEAIAAAAARLTASGWPLMNGQPAAYGGLSWHEYNPDRASYFVSGGAGNADQMIAYLAETARSREVSRISWSSRLDDDQLAKMKRWEEEPHTLASRNFLRALFAAQPWWSPVVADDLKSVARADAQAWVERTQEPANATLVVVGDVNPATIQQDITAAFSPWEAKKTAPPPPTLPEPTGDSQAPSSGLRFEVAGRPGATQAEWRFGCFLPHGATRSASIRHDLAARILETRLTRLLREELGATYSLQVWPRSRQGGTAFLELQTVVDNAKLDLALGQFDRSVRALAATPPTSDELAAARLSRAGSQALARMTNLAIARGLIDELGEGGIVDDEAAMVGAVTAQEVSSEVQACLAGNPVLSLLGEEAVLSAAVKRFKERPATASR